MITFHKKKKKFARRNFRENILWQTPTTATFREIKFPQKYPKFAKITKVSSLKVVEQTNIYAEQYITKEKDLSKYATNND